MTTKTFTFDLDTEESKELLAQMTKLAAAIGVGEFAESFGLGRAIGHMSDMVSSLLALVGDEDEAEPLFSFKNGENALDYAPRLIELLGHEEKKVCSCAKELLLQIEGAYPLVLEALKPGIEGALRIEEKRELGELLIDELVSGEAELLPNQLIAGKKTCFPAALDKLIQLGKTS